MKSTSELEELHGREYVDDYDRSHEDQRLERLCKYIRLEDYYDVADFGCGSGLLMELLAARVNSYVGVDFSLPFIEAANEKKTRLGIKNATFQHSSIEDYCQDNPCRFHACFAMDFSEHVYDADWRTILENIKLSLKKNGKFYMHTPNADFFLEIMKQHDFILHQFPQHIAVRTPEHNIQLLQDAGFEISSLSLLPHYNRLVKWVHVLSWLPLVGKYFKARIFIEARKM